MPKREEVTIQKDGYEAHVAKRSVAGYLRHGWTLVDDGSSDPVAAKPEVQPQPAQQPTSRKAE